MARLVLLAVLGTLFLLSCLSNGEPTTTPDLNGDLSRMEGAAAGRDCVSRERRSEDKGTEGNQGMLRAVDPYHQIFPLASSSISP